MPASLHLITKLKFHPGHCPTGVRFHRRHSLWTYLELNNNFLYYWVASWAKIKYFLFRKMPHFLQNVWNWAFRETHRRQIFLQTFIIRIAIGKTMDIDDQWKSLISKTNTHWGSSLEISVFLNPSAQEKKKHILFFPDNQRERISRSENNTKHITCVKWINQLLVKTCQLGKIL